MFFGKSVEGAAIAPHQVVRRQDRGAPVRLVLILLLLNLAVGGASYYYLTKVSPSLVDLVMADGKVDVFPPGSAKPKRLQVAPDLPVGTVIATRDVPRSALRFSSVVLRLAPRTKVRILRGGPLATSGVEVALEAGRLWVERDSSWVPVTVRVGDERLRPGVGNTEVRRSSLLVLGWNATVYVDDARGRQVFQVDLGAGGKKVGDRWIRARLPGLVDAWTAWNMHTTATDLLTGDLMDMAVAHRLERPPQFGPSKEPRRAASPAIPRGEEVALGGPPSRRVQVPGLPGRDYPTRPGGSPDGAPGAPPPLPGDPPAAPDAAPPPPPGPPPAGERRTGGRGRLTWTAPERLTQKGREEPPAGAPDLTRNRSTVRGGQDVSQLRSSIERTLASRFGMELRQPFQLLAAPDGDQDVALRGNVSRVMSLKNKDGVWVAKIADGVHADEFAVWAAAMYASAWLKEQGLDHDADASGFTRWISFKYALAAGLVDQARSIPNQGGATSAWVDHGQGRSFEELWALEEARGEQGVFDKLLEAEIDESAY